MSATIKLEELKAGDVLLYQGTSFISRMIRLFDGSEYSHSSVYDGAKIAEAVAEGVVSHTVKESVADIVVDVYRFRSASGAKLGDPEFPVDPVTSRIKYYLSRHERYAYEQILFLAVLATTRRLPVVGWIPGLGSLLRTVLDSATDILNKIIAAGKEPMICSELVYRCYDEAAEDKYHLKIIGAEVLMRHSLHEAASMGLTTLGEAGRGDREQQELLAASETFLRRYATAKGMRMPMAFGMPVVADFVTPRDLKSSPNLNFAGTLENTRR